MNVDEVSRNTRASQADKLWRFEGMLRVYCYDGKVIKSPVFSVPWDKLRAWYHKNPTFAPAFLMRFAPTLAIDAAASAGAVAL